MLKRIKIIKLLFVVIIISGNTIFAQTKNFEVGLHGAPFASTLQGGREFRKIFNIGYIPKLGPFTGFYFQKSINDKAAYRLEANYEQKGFTAKFDMTDENGKYYQERVTYFYDYLTIPLIFQYKKEKEKIGYFLNGGIYTGYRLRSGWYAPAVKGVHPEQRYVNKAYAPFFDFGLVTGGGARFAINEFLSFSVELRNNLGIKALGKSSLGSTRNESFGILFGLTYQFKEKK